MKFTWNVKNLKTTRGFTHKNTHFLLNCLLLFAQSIWNLLFNRHWVYVKLRWQITYKFQLCTDLSFRSFNRDAWYSCSQGHTSPSCMVTPTLRVLAALRASILGFGLSQFLAIKCLECLGLNLTEGGWHGMMDRW